MQAPEDIRVVLGCGVLAEVNCPGMERISQHGFQCVLRHPSPSGRTRRFSADSVRGRRTRPSREGSARARFRSSHSCVWVQRYHHTPQAGPWPWAWAWALVLVRLVESCRLAAAVGLGESS